MKFIQTNQAPKAVGPYSQAIMIKDTLYVSGQLPFDPEKMILISEDIKDQTQKCLDNLLAIVESAGLKKENIIRCGVYMKDLSKFNDMNQVYADFFKTHKPARTTIEVSRLPKDVDIEIDCIAVKD